MTTLFTPSFPAQRHTPGDRAAFVLMSGGVDSACTALLLQQQGWDVTGITMEILPDSAEKCVLAAAETCRQLEIPHYFIDLKQLFQERVISPFCKSYLIGETPNPCVACNAHFKFGLLWDALETFFPAPFFVASGHYARLVTQNGVPTLCRAADLSKDQSYFLSQISAKRLSRLLLPLGEFTKEQTRTLAREGGLVVAEKKDSMEICFAGEGSYHNLIQTEATPGAILNLKGERIGTHQGISHYTQGQRKGLQISAPHPLYVVAISPQKNTLTVAPREEAFSHHVYARSLNVLDASLCQEGSSLWGKIRSGGTPMPCSITQIAGTELSIFFDQAQFAPAPGQTVALYASDGHLVAGATITTP